MPKNEEGEFELVLGNRQLLSIFFIVVILFGVFFTMGYIVGRNSAPTVAAAPAPTKAPETAATTARVPANPPAEAAPVQPPAQAPASEPAATTPAPQTQAAKEPAPPAAKREEEPPAAKPAAEPSGKIYLQVAAVGRPEAELEVSTLKKRGFPAHVGPGPREGIFRVLVGPYKNTADTARAKGELEKLGFKPIVRK